MKVEDAFLQAILRDPDDDGPRLVYADWLEENGQGERAQLIRLQCQLARMAPAEPRWRELYLHSRELLDRYRSQWLGPLGPIQVGRGVEWPLGDFAFVRGLVEQVWNLSAENFAARADDLFRLAPLLRDATLFVTVEGVATLAACPNLARLTSLSLDGQVVPLDEHGAVVLAGSPYLSGLTRLDLDRNRIGDEGARAIADSPHLARLTSLDLGGNLIGPQGAEALAASSYLRSLTDLNLSGNPIGVEGVRALARSPLLEQLTHLDCSFTGSGLEGVQVLAASLRSASLKVLHLVGNEIGDAGAREIARSPYLVGLIELDLRSNHLSLEAVQDLASPPHLPLLTKLIVSGNLFDDVTLSGSPGLSLQTIDQIKSWFGRDVEIAYPLPIDW